MSLAPTTPRWASWCLYALMFGLAGLVIATSDVQEARASQARSPRHRCAPVRREVIARRGASLLFIHRTGLGDGKYGAPHALYGCRTAHQALARLFDFEDGDTPETVLTAFNGAYAAFFIGWQSTTCSFYESAGAIDCSQSLLASVNLGSGHTRVNVTNEDPNTTDPPTALVVTHAGWIAWAAHLTATSQPLLARDSGGERTLDPGPIDTGSLRVSGANVRWTDAGVTHTAGLG